MEFVKADGYEDSGSYLEFKITNGSSDYCLGDIIWCDKTTLLISDYISEYELITWFEECNNPHMLHNELVFRIQPPEGRTVVNTFEEEEIYPLVLHRIQERFSK